MRDARFRDAGRNPRPGALPRDARLALDNRPTAETLDDDSRPSRLGAPPNRRRPEDDVSSSSPSSESPPPLVSALAVSSRLLARFSPLCLAERRAFRHLARAARRLDLVASMRTRRSATPATRVAVRVVRVSRRSHGGAGVDAARVGAGGGRARGGDVFETQARRARGFEGRGGTSARVRLSLIHI